MNQCEKEWRDYCKANTVALHPTYEDIRRAAMAMWLARGRVDAGAAGGYVELYDYSYNPDLTAEERAKTRYPAGRRARTAAEIVSAIAAIDQEASK